ncbi:threonine synthase [Pedobacter metabolipauper]|uniref:Threonine synthase n=1 Tax=Pedobacter metabolipauper TaxID=425513 RepID=A0A4R6SWA7_9SPHI|nr:threonine synthase [Pedobacter metabolipauper]TDQ10100.1 L-threonine synthase [Pedobacter metabolipauper]
MKLYSTNNHRLSVDFETAVFNSMPLDKGLFMPAHIPALDPEFIAQIHEHTLPEIAFKVASALLAEVMPADDLKQIIDEAINFEAPLKTIGANTYVLELFHGPSLAFKDFGARFMSRVMAYFLKDNQKILDVLVATSGDTGGAVALGFLGVPNTRVTILYPKGKVSEIQELQLCTNGQNIHAIEVDGTFDDCQRLVKEAFADEALNDRLRLTSANSINISRLIPQTFYYFNAYAELKRLGKAGDVVFSVPSGNFGNIAAGLLAYKMGLPVKQFIAATNVNDSVPRYLETGVYETRPSVQTYANAMDVGAPSNWVRIMDLFDQDRDAILNILKGYRFTDEETLVGIKALDEQFGYVACPHTAIAWLAFQKYGQEDSGKYTGVFLSTAHACKFPDVFPENIRMKIEIPEQVKSLLAKEKSATAMKPDYEAFKNYLTTFY